jgi:hypothetical protein
MAIALGGVRVTMSFSWVRCASRRIKSTACKAQVWEATAFERRGVGDLPFFSFTDVQVPIKCFAWHTNRRSSRALRQGRKQTGKWLLAPVGI